MTFQLPFNNPVEKISLQKDQRCVENMREIPKLKTQRLLSRNRNRPSEYTFLVFLLKNIFSDFIILFLELLILGVLCWKIFDLLTIIYEATQYNWDIF